MRSRAAAGSVGQARPLPSAPRVRRPRRRPVPELKRVPLREKLRLASGASVRCHPASVALRWFCSPTSTRPGQTEASPGCTLHTRTGPWRGRLGMSFLPRPNTPGSLIRCWLTVEACHLSVS